MSWKEWVSSNYRYLALTTAVHPISSFGGHSWKVPLKILLLAADETKVVLVPCDWSDNVTYIYKLPEAEVLLVADTVEQAEQYYRDWEANSGLGLAALGAKRHQSNRCRTVM